MGRGWEYMQVYGVMKNEGVWGCSGAERENI